MNSYIVFWNTKVGGWNSRAGHTVVHARDKRDARKVLRKQINIIRDERLFVSKVIDHLV